MTWTFCFLQVATYQKTILFILPAVRTSTTDTFSIVLIDLRPAYTVKFLTVKKKLYLEVSVMWCWFQNSCPVNSSQHHTQRNAFFFFGLGGYWHCGHPWPIVSASGDSEDDCGETDGMQIGRGNRSSRRKPAPAPLLSITKSHMTRPGFEPGPPATNRLSYGAAYAMLLHGSSSEQVAIHRSALLTTKLTWEVGLFTEWTAIVYRNVMFSNLVVTCKKIRPTRL
jgi:hypothetical protein